MKRSNQIILFIFLAVFLSSGTCIAADIDLEANPWKKWGFTVGGFLSTVDTGIRFGGKLGFDINVEDTLNLDVEQTVFRIDSYWRFTNSRKHRLDLYWFAFRRDGTNVLLRDIQVEDPNNPGNEITIPASTKVSSSFDIDIFKLAYSYSIFQDNRMDIALQGGLFVMPINMGLSASGIFGGEAGFDVIAPLPTVGARADFAITPKWFLKMASEFFYLEYQTFKGSLFSGTTGLEYNPWKNVGLGLGFESFYFDVESEKGDYPGIDFTGKVGLNYTGIKLYLNVFF